VTETRDDTVTWLTQEAYDRLKSELDYLTGTGRTEIAKRIEAAREEGDLRENGGYHAAKEEQGKQESRILQIMHILDNSRVGDPPRTDGVVGPGMTVTVRFAGDEDEVTFLLASREESGAPIDVYSPRSPLGAAISGKKVGESATYTLPNGTEVVVAGADGSLPSPYYVDVGRSSSVTVMVRFTNSEPALVAYFAFATSQYCSYSGTGSASTPPFAVVFG